MRFAISSAGHCHRQKARHALFFTIWSGRAGGRIASRVDASTEQLTVFRDIMANRQDSSKARPLQVGGIFLDSTKPAGRGPMEISLPEKEVLERIHLEDYLTPDVINQLQKDT